MGDTEIILAMQEAVRKSLAEAATEEIKKQAHKFECEMGKIKQELIGKMINEIRIMARKELSTGGYIIQILLKG